MVRRAAALAVSELAREGQFVPLPPELAVIQTGHCCWMDLPALQVYCVPGGLQADP